MKTGFEINGRRYVTTDVIADIWGVKRATATEYCRAEIVLGAIKDSSGRWMIPVDTPKPLGKTVIKNVLCLVLQLKNDSNIKIDYDNVGVKAEDLPSAFEYVEKLKLIESIPEGCPAEEIPYKVQLTREGMKLALEPAKKSKDKPESANITNIVEIAKCIAALAALAKYAMEIYSLAM